MNFLSLFTGIGTHDLGLEWAGMTVGGQCEIESYCLNVLRRHWPGVPRWRDVRDVNKASIIERCGRLPDLITGGFPCQQISGLNNNDRQGVGSKKRPSARSGLVWQMLRIIEECEPRWVLLENVPGLRIEGADDILESLERAGYSCWPLVVGAAHVGAPHERKRVWIAGCQLAGIDLPVGIVGRALADADRVAIEQRQTDGPVASAEILADFHGTGMPDRELRGQTRRDADRCSKQWWPAPPGPTQYEWEAQRTADAEREMGRPVDGRANRLALEALGNCNPPQVACAIGRAIMRIDAELTGASATPILCRDDRQFDSTTLSEEKSKHQHVATL